MINQASAKCQPSVAHGQQVSPICPMGSYGQWIEDDIGRVTHLPFRPFCHAKSVDNGKLSPGIARNQLLIVTKVRIQASL